jgi:4,5:9,10-diseco-3-hydroxy-5,9,17-trioxoandrosta-1(10),2-diene-4-oate hydrolase
MRETTLPENRFTDVGGVRVRYWAAGPTSTDPPLLLIHGIGTFMESWIANFRNLARNFRVYALDLPGHGNSDRPRKNYSVEYYANFIDEFLKTQGLARIRVMGNSFGGGVALQYAHLFPAKTDRVILVANPGFGRNLSLSFRIMGIPLIGRFILRIRKNEQSARSRSAGILTALLYDPANLDPSLWEILIEKYTEMALTRGSGRAIHNVLRRYTNIFGIKARHLRAFDMVFPTIATPVLILWGENDTMIPVDQAHRGRTLLRNASLHVLKNCGHMPQLEHPEHIEGLVVDFLSR